MNARIAPRKLTGQGLRELRLSLGLGQTQLARAVGLHRNAVRYWERAARVDPRGHAPRLILAALGVSVDDKLSNTRGRARASWGDTKSAERLRPNFIHRPDDWLDNFRTLRAGARAHHGVKPQRPKITPRSARPRCGARTRTGLPCRAPVVSGISRCRMHGGLSSGARTAEGRARIAEAQRARWRRWRKAKEVSSTNATDTKG